MLTLIMYHYVRDLPRTGFPHIRGLLTEKFDGQLDYISKNYTVCSLAEVIAASRGECELPQNACVLTFDDGFTDHYQTVFPRLLDRGLKGAFFPSALPIEERRVLDVHKVQFILSATVNHHELMQEVLRQVDGYRERFTIPTADQLLKEFVVPGRFDAGEVIFIKRMLQWILPEQIRSEVTDRLFRKYVSQDEESFARELYMDIPQLREMATGGMEIGGHGYRHLWLGELSLEDQLIEIQHTVRFLNTVFGHSPSDWAMCYPFGSYNSDTLRLVSKMGCAIGLTTKVGLTNFVRPLELERLDCNDLPFAGDAPISTWTNLARESDLIPPSCSERATF